MPDSINRVTGHLQQGYACANCGDSCNLYATGHYNMKERIWLCENRTAQFLSPKRILEIEQSLKADGWI